MLKYCGVSEDFNLLWTGVGTASQALSFRDCAQQCDVYKPRCHHDDFKIKPAQTAIAKIFLLAVA